MEIVFMISVAIALLVVIITILFLKQKIKKTENKRAQEGRPVRGQIDRNQRNRLRQGTTRTRETLIENTSQDIELNDDVIDNPKGASMNEKLGSKKKAKVEAKEQKRILREQELLEREKQKEIDVKKEEERKLQEDKIVEEENKKIEAERLAREERERKEYKEYLKLKADFNVEEEGFDDNQMDKQELLNKFVEFIKFNKVVVLEDLSSEFKLRTQQVIDKIQELQNMGLLTGVIDDRGKFIYISEDELLAVAKFISQHGRVSIAELAESSNQLIGLTSITSII